MLEWIPYELHCHTNHSDGHQTLSELGSNARELGFQGFALTDHNTISAFGDIDTVKSESKLTIIPSMEWTTFNGHVLLLGIEKYYEWRDLTLDNLEEKIIEPKNDGVIVGLAHPFRVGSPMNTGCNMEYSISNWDNINYIEVWSGTNPGLKYDNIKAFELWTTLLNKGYEICATSGRDWHRYEDTQNLISSTYIGISSDEKNDVESVLKAIKKGRIVVSDSLLLDMKLETNNNMWTIGDIVTYSNYEKLNLNVNIMQGKVKNNFIEDSSKLTLKITSNIGTIKELEVKNDDKLDISIIEFYNELIWIRAELYRENEDLELIAFTNPIYF